MSSDLRKIKKATPKRNENILRLFVYGSLKRGHWNHRRFCATVLTIQPAEVWGRLYHLPGGYPAIELPEDRILAEGTIDPIADTQKLHFERELNFERPEGDWDLILGELLTFNDPQNVIPPIDWLEGFSPGKLCLYQRAMTTVLSNNVKQSAYLYRMLKVTEGYRLPREYRG
ncbi:MAG: gamma-glutamylcyclotransferase [Deltaproteobacteria bacterium]|jgi:gamma-glutamylcyclotransferase (GGCT)/AIG2-like uncharacterized protein YtfP|nr:gamma-glutamylcyclotransferase [Deltaproteobacteria bacterium]